MPVYSFDEAPAEVRELLARSRNERRNPAEVRKELARLGVTSVMQMMYLRDGLGLSLEQAKRVVMSASGSDDASFEEMGHATSEIISDNAAPKED